MSITEPAVFYIIAGIILLLAELSTFTAWLACLGIGAIITGVAGAMGIDHIAVQAFIFAASSLVLLLIVRHAFPNHFRGKVVRSTTDAQDDTGLMGLHGQVATDFAGGEGTVTLNGVKWDALADPLAPLHPGDRVKVIGKKGIRLLVEPA